MDVTQLRNLYGAARIDDRQVNELIGLAHGLIADGIVNQKEAKYLHKWLAANKDATRNPLISSIFNRVQDYFSDGVLDDDEARELFQTLQSLSGGDFELGEALKSTNLPLCDPPPAVAHDKKRFCFTGTFASGNRKHCESKAQSLGATTGSLIKSTDFLVVGVYATDSWMHSSFGRKIEKAVEFRSSGYPIAIIGEEHWVCSFADASTP